MMCSYNARVLRKTRRLGRNPCLDNGPLGIMMPNGAQWTVIEAYEQTLTILMTKLLYQHLTTSALAPDNHL